MRCLLCETDVPCNAMEHGVLAKLTQRVKFMKSHRISELTGQVTEIIKAVRLSQTKTTEKLSRQKDGTRVNEKK